MPRDVRRAKEPTRSQLTVKPLAVFTFAFVRDDYNDTRTVHVHVLYTYLRKYEGTTRTLGSTFVLSYFRTFVRKYFRKYSTRTTLYFRTCTLFRS